MSNIIFDGPNKLMVVASGIQELDAEVDVYSDWKEWLIEDNNSKYLQALRTSGGDPTVPGQFVAPFYFLMNGWRMRPYEGDHQLVVNGNLFVDGGGNPFVPTVGAYNVLVTLNVSNLATAIISQLEISNLQRLIETGREHHTGTGNIWYWDPYGGDDLNDGTAQADAFKTFAKTHDSAVNNNHDIIICVPGDPGGVTTTTENCTISKNYLFVRGPGRDFRVAPTTGRAFTVISNGVEVSSMIAESADDCAIVVEGGDFALLKTLWIDSSALNSIEINNSDHSRIGKVHVKDSLSNGLAVGNNVADLHIDELDVHYSSGHGITLSGTNIDSVKIKATLSCENGGYGLNIGSGAECTTINADVTIANNTLGNINDEGIDTSFGGDIQADIITDKVWDESQSGHTSAGTFGNYLDSKVSEAGGGGLTASGVEIDAITIKLPSGDIAESGEYTTLLNNIEAYVLRTLGLTQENYYLDNTEYTSYQGAKLLTGGRLRIYSSAGSVGTGSDVIATYQITSVWTNDELDTYKVVKQ